MSVQNPAMKRMYPQGILELEGPSTSDRVEVMVESSSPPDGPGGGIVEVLCRLAASQAPPVLIEPYAFLEALREETTVRYRAKRDPRWEPLITAPERARRAMALR